MKTMHINHAPRDRGDLDAMLREYFTTGKATITRFETCRHRKDCTIQGRRSAKGAVPRLFRGMC